MNKHATSGCCQEANIDMQGDIITLGQAMDELTGKKLTIVQFVHDYLQLGFEGAALTVYRPPTLHTDRGVFGWLTPEFRHELCLLIEAVVTATATDDDSVSIRFESGSLLTLQIDESDGSAPESLEFSLEGTTTTWIA